MAGAQLFGTYRISGSICRALVNFCRQTDNRLTLTNVPSPLPPERPRGGGASGELLLRGLQHCELFRDWEPALLKDLAAAARLKWHPRGGQLTFALPEHAELIIVVSGSIEFSGFNAQGEKFMLTVLGAGGVAGLYTLVGDPRYRNYSYVIREGAYLVHLRSAVLRAALDKNPLHWRAVAAMALARNENNILQMERRALASIPQRIAQAIMRLAQLSGRAGQRGEIKVRISQSDLAAMASVSRQTANQELGVLARRGIIAMRYTEMTILDIKAVRDLVNQTSQRLA